MTQADQNRSATETCCQLYYLINPGTGSAYTLSVPNTGTARTLYVFLHSFIPPGSATASCDTSLGSVGSVAVATSGNMTLSATGNLVVSCAGTGYKDAPTGNGDAGTYTDIGNFSVSQQYELAAASTTYAATFTQGGDDDSCVCAVSIKAPRRSAPRRRSSRVPRAAARSRH